MYENEKENAALIAEYLKFLEFRNRADTTKRNYEVSLRQLYEHCKETGISFLKMNTAEYFDYMRLKFKTYAPSTQHAKIAACKTFFDYLVMYRRRDYNPIIQMFYPRVEKKKLSTMGINEFLSFRSYIKEHSSDTMLLGVDLMYWNGLRISEAENVDLINDVKQEDGAWVVTIFGKGAKYRTVPILGKEVNLVERIKRMRSNHNSILPLRIGNLRSTVQYHLDNWKKKNEISEHHTAHSFRRSFAKNTMEQTKDIELVRVLMGHENYTTTLRYLYGQTDLLERTNAIR